MRNFNSGSLGSLFYYQVIPRDPGIVPFLCA